jgi:hypothetical protein
LVAAVAFLVLTPLLLYFWRQPEVFWLRIDQVAPASNSSLRESYVRSLAMFFIRGDPYWRFNLPGRPLFNWFWGALLLIGWGGLARRLLQVQADWRRAAVLLLLLAPFLMVLPTALATGEIVPSNLRAIGLIPFIFILPAVGFSYGLRYVPLRASRPWAAAAVALILVAGGLATGWSYFQTWATRADVYYESDADLAAVARFLDQETRPDQPIYLAARHYRHPTVAFLSRHYGRIRWLPQSQALVFPASGPALIIYPRSSPAPPWALPYLAGAKTISGEPGPDGRPAFTAYEVTAVPLLTIPNSVVANFGHLITLIGYQAGQAQSGVHLPLTLYWRVHGRPADPTTANFIPFIHLEDIWRYRWSQVETFAYPAEQWTVGDLIIQQVDVPVRAGTPPGSYRLRVGLFAPDSGVRLPHLDEAGRYAGDSFVIDNALVTPGAPPATLPAPPLALDQVVAPGLRLLGFERGSATVENGDNYWLALWWQATAPLPLMTVRLELYRPDNQGYILTNTAPVGGTYPFAHWTAPQFVIDHIRPKIPLNVPPGPYRLQLRLLDSQNQTLHTADLGPLTVTATERLFQPPRLQQPQAAVFGNEIRLLGYDLETITPRHFRLQLAWQAITTPATDYTVFVHLLEPTGVCCAWQQDAAPRQGSYATTRWLPGEVVLDAYDIYLAEETAVNLYPLEIGLYIAETGQRLLVDVPGLPGSDALYLRPLSVE